MKDAFMTALGIFLFVGCPFLAGAAAGWFFSVGIVSRITAGLIIIAGFLVLLFWDTHDGSSHNMGILYIFGGMPALAIVGMWFVKAMLQLPWTISFSLHLLPK